MKLKITALLGLLLLTASAAQAVTFALGTSTLFEGPSAGSDSVVLAVTPPTGTWTATTNATWLHLSPANQNGAGSTNVIFSFDANPGGTRSGTLTIGGQTLNVTQAGSAYVLTTALVPVVSSGLSQPHGVAVDGTGNIYIADSGNQAIKKWSIASNTVTTILSSGLNNPYSVAVDGGSNVYIADSGNSTIDEWIAANSNVVTLVSSGLYSPSGVAVDTSGNVYIADGYDDVVFEWEAANSNLVTLSSLQPTFLCSPPGIAVDRAGNVYFDDTCNDVINEWVAANSNGVTFSVHGFYLPTGVAVDGSGNVYVADQADNWIWQWSPVNNALTVVVAGLNRPDDVAVDSAGNPFIADTQNNKVEELVRIWVDPATRSEGLAAGHDALPPTLPAPPTLTALSPPTSNQPWLTITGVTNGIVSFSFSATTSTRTGIISWLGQAVAVIQRAPSQSLGATTLVEGPSAGTDSIVLSVYPFSTTWTATANAAWLHLSAANQAGTGCTNVILSFDANPGATRSGTLTIAGQTLTVTQAATSYVAAGTPTTLASGLSYGYGISVDSSGNVYIVVNDFLKILKWTATNDTVTTVVSSGLENPQGVVVDSADNIYIGNLGDGTIKKATGSTAITVAGGLASPDAFGVDTTGNLYFTGNGAIQEWTAASGVVSMFASTGSVGSGGVAVDGAADTVYFQGGTTLQKWSAQNNAVTQLASSAFTFGNGFATDGEGNVYSVAADGYIDQIAIMKWTAANNTLTTLLDSGEAQYFGVAVDSAGNLYYTDAYGGLLWELPRAFVDPTPKTEGLAAGQDSLPAVLPSKENLLAPFAPSSDSSWLTIASVNNGVVGYSFTQNLSLTRTGHITLLGRSIPVNQNGPAFTLGTTNVCEGPAVGTDSVVLAVAPNIGIWTATANFPWLHLSAANQAGTGSTNVIFSFDANPGGTRSGTLTIAGQTLTVTQAGSGYVGVDTLAVLASSGLSDPSGVAADGAGNIYIADPTNNAIEKWSVTNNTLIALISSGLSNPSGVAVDGAGNVYIADTGDSAIKEWTAASSNLTTLVSSGLANPAGVTVDSAGNVYIADTGNGLIKKWGSASNTVTTLVSSGLSSPSGVAVDGAGNVYFADTGDSAIKEWMAAGSNVNTLVSAGLSNPAGVALDGAGNVYIADTGNSAIKKWTAASNTVTTLVSSGLSNPAGLTVDGAGNVYIADTGDFAIKELPRAFVDPTARVEPADAGNGALPTVLPAAENLLAPFAPTVDQPWLSVSGVTNGVVSFSFAANFGSSRTAHFTLLGQMIVVTQSGLTYVLGTTSLLVGPPAGSNSVVLGVAPKTATWTASVNATWLHLAGANQSGTGGTNVIFSFDANPGRTRSGTLTIAGQTLTVTQAGSTYMPAGILAVLVSSGLATPYGVAVDGMGNVYIADSYNYAIKEWTASNNNVTTLIASGLTVPLGVAADSAGDVYIADTYDSAIKERPALNSNVMTLVSSGLDYPGGVAGDGAGNIYIADSFNNAIKEWSAGNNNVTTLVASGLSNPKGVAVDAADNVYIADTAHNAIKQWSPLNNNLATLVASGLSNPNGVAVDGAGDVYIADAAHNAIKEWSPVNNNVTTLVALGLSNPNGVAVDAADNVYIADTSHNAIKELSFAFVDPTGKLEGLAAGNDFLPAVLPPTANLMTPFAPTSDQSWLTITGIANGVVSFAFTANTGPARTAHIALLGRTISITQGLIGTPPRLTGVQTLGNGAVQFSFTNNPSASFTVLSTTNMSMPLASWTVVGLATNVSLNLFQFTSQATTNDQRRYYIVRSP